MLALEILTIADQLSGQSLYRRTMALNSNELVYSSCTMACSRPGHCLDLWNDKKMHAEFVKYMVWMVYRDIFANVTLQVVAATIDALVYQ